MAKYTFVNGFESYPMVMEIAWNMSSEVFVVGGWHEHDCLDNFADYCEENEFWGAFVDVDDILDEEELEQYVSVGNHCYPMDLNQFVITFK
jgi:hypothetical protein